mmetsp:Transcript_36957/g.98449  ORF Transcript_36957/g.98449 Transcript_36957/m.98449 type:complete len:251 (-) Transcript_36957:118-870(-)
MDAVVAAARPDPKAMPRLLSGAQIEDLGYVEEYMRRHDLEDEFVAIWVIDAENRTNMMSRSVAVLLLPCCWPVAICECLFCGRLNLAHQQKVLRNTRHALGKKRFYVVCDELKNGGGYQDLEHMSISDNSYSLVLRLPKDSMIGKDGSYEVLCDDPKAAAGLIRKQIMAAQREAGRFAIPTQIGMSSSAGKIAPPRERPVPALVPELQEMSSSSKDGPAEMLEKLQILMDRGIVTQLEFEAKRAELLARM